MSKIVYITCQNQQSPSDKFLRRFDMVMSTIWAFWLSGFIAAMLNFSGQVETTTYGYVVFIWDKSFNGGI